MSRQDFSKIPYFTVVFKNVVTRFSEKCRAILKNVVIFEKCRTILKNVAKNLWTLLFRTLEGFLNPWETWWTNNPPPPPIWEFKNWWKFKIFRKIPISPNDHIYSFRGSKIQILEKSKNQLIWPDIGGGGGFLVHHNMDRQNCSADTNTSFRWTVSNSVGSS